jgi:hypothetical protein
MLLFVCNGKSAELTSVSHPSSHYPIVVPMFPNSISSAILASRIGCAEVVKATRLEFVMPSDPVLNEVYSRMRFQFKINHCKIQLLEPRATNSTPPITAHQYFLFLYNMFTENINNKLRNPETHSDLLPKEGDAIFLSLISLLLNLSILSYAIYHITTGNASSLDGFCLCNLLKA